MKEKIQLEYPINSSTKVLFDQISTPSGLSNWFADNVNLKDDLFIFIWDGTEERARVVSKRSEKYIRFQWEDDDEGYFEFRIDKDEITNETILLVTDFLEEDEIDEAIDLWDSQIASLKRILGL
jgi:uncharacterized protein YndB with AHSA1/START domain